MSSVNITSTLMEPWHLYLKTDGTNFLIWFSISDPNQDSIYLDYVGTILSNDGVMG